MIWLTVITLVFILLLLILVHEWGHFYTAKKAGCKVDEFGFGFPPRLFAFKRGETTYSFNLLPLGGFVKIEGENMDGDTNSPSSFASKSATWRIIILSAGVFMNMVLAVVLLSIQAGVGMPVGVTEENRAKLKDIKTYVIDIDEDSRATEAGFMQYDRIVSVNGTDNPTADQISEALAEEGTDDVIFEVSRQGQQHTISLPSSGSQSKTIIMDVAEESPAFESGLQVNDTVVDFAGAQYPTLEDIQTVTQDNLGKEVSITVDRNGELLTLPITPRTNPPAGQGAMGIKIENISMAGMHLDSAGLQKTPWWQTPWEGLKRTWLMLSAIVIQFALLIQRAFTEGGIGEALTGPVGIAIYANEAANMGLSYLLEFSALISINLAIINLLPLPALDGGRIFFIVIEKIIGRRLPPKVENITHLVGFALLLLLMVLITFKDVQRYF